METKTPGVRHVMVGVPGKIGNWLQAEQGVGSLLTNPAALSGIAGLMAQVAGQQTAAEIINYLERIDAKVDDVLGKVDDTVLKDMRGARFQIRRAHTMRVLEGRVTSDAWSEVQNASGKLADVQGYALLQLEAIAEKLESKERVGGLATASDEAGPEVRKWLAVLADCFRLQESFDVLALDKAMDEATDYTNSIAVKENEDALAEIKASGKTTFHTLTAEQEKAWRAAMQPTYQWAKGRVGSEVLDVLSKATSV
jgi:hypothetical protein